MKNYKFIKSLSFIICALLIAVIALSAAGCNGKRNIDNPIDVSSTQSNTDVEPTVLGEGTKTFNFTVIDSEGKESIFEIHTDETIVGNALTSLNLISGEVSTYGLYVKTVNGLTLDFDKDGKYWAFYVNGEYASSGVDSTEITEGATYSFKAES